METNAPAIPVRWNERLISRIAVIAVTLAALAAAAASHAAYVNTTTGAPLRPGVYGRIEVGKAAPPPPVIYNQPMVASQSPLRPGVRPVYLYVPPGQARKWPRHCGKYQACELPVYFVRVDDSPSKLGRWKDLTRVAQRSDQQ